MTKTRGRTGSVLIIVYILACFTTLSVKTSCVDKAGLILSLLASTLNKNLSYCMQRDRATRYDSWNVNCCINVRKIAFEKAWNKWMTLKVTRSHWQWRGSMQQLKLQATWLLPTENIITSVAGRKSRWASADILVVLSLIYKRANK